MHIGKLIEQRVKDSNISIDDFAQMLNVSRSSIYSIFESEDIFLSKLNIISNVLNYDFIGVSGVNEYSLYKVTVLVETDAKTFLNMEKNDKIKIHKIYSL